MNVYIAQYFEVDQGVTGSRILGVFATEQSAVECCEAFVKADDGAAWKRSKTDLSLWECGRYTWVEIDTHEVK